MKRLGFAALILAALVFLAELALMVHIALGTTFTLSPSTPITIIDLQGRPISGGTFTVKDTDGNPVTVYSDTAGTTPMSRLPKITTNVLQFYTSPGIYQVTALGPGNLQHQFWTPVLDAAALVNLTRISISRPAETFNLATTSPVTLNCTAGNGVCFLVYPDASTTTALADWIMPSFPVTFQTLLLSWWSSASGSTVVWQVDWCTYANGQATCLPDGTNAVSFTSTKSDSDRTDILVDSEQWATTWSAGDHVVVSVSRLGSSGGDDITGNVNLENARFEFKK